LSTGKWFNDEAEDQGIQTAEDSRFFGLSAGFESFSNAGAPSLVVEMHGYHMISHDGRPAKKAAVNEKAYSRLFDYLRLISLSQWDSPLKMVQYIPLHLMCI